MKQKFKLILNCSCLYLFCFAFGLLFQRSESAIQLPDQFRPCISNLYETCTAIYEIDDGYKMVSDMVRFKTSKNRNAVFTILKTLTNQFYKVLALDLDKGFFYEDSAYNNIEIVSYSQSSDYLKRAVGIYNEKTNTTGYYYQKYDITTQNLEKNLLITLQGNKNIGNAVWYDNNTVFLFNFDNTIYRFSQKSQKLEMLFQVDNSKNDLYPIIFNKTNQIILVSLLSNKTFELQIYDQLNIGLNGKFYKKNDEIKQVFQDYQIRDNKLWTIRELSKLDYKNSLQKKFDVDINDLKKKVVSIEILNLDTQKIEGQKYVIWENVDSNEFVFFNVSLTQEYFVILLKDSIKIWKITQNESYLYNEIRINPLSCINLTFLEDNSMFCQNFEQNQIRYFTKTVGIVVDELPSFLSYIIICLAIVIIILLVVLQLCNCIKKRKKKQMLDKLYEAHSVNNKESWIMQEQSISFAGIKSSFVTMNSNSHLGDSNLFVNSIEFPLRNNSERAIKPKYPNTPKKARK